MAKVDELFQQGLYVGFGLAHRTKERIEEVAQRVSRDFEMTEEEGHRFLEDLLKGLEESNSRLDEFIGARLENYFKEAGVPSKEDIDTLIKKVEELEKKL